MSVIVKAKAPVWLGKLLSVIDDFHTYWAGFFRGGDLFYKHLLVPDLMPRRTGQCPAIFG